MRGIKFRGKRLDNLEWVYGNLIEHYDIFDRTKKYYYIESFTGEDRNEVIPETIGQFTGLKDKNGKEIIEGDIVVVIKISIDDKPYNARVVFQEIGRSGFAYVIDYGGNDGKLYYGLQDQQHIKVIGNIHDNKEKL